MRTLYNTVNIVIQISKILFLSQPILGTAKFLLVWTMEMAGVGFQDTFDYFEVIRNRKFE